MSNDSEQIRKTRLRVSSSALVRVLYKRSVKIIAIALLVVLAIYMCFAATILRFVPSTSETGIQLVKNVTNEGGVLNPGERVMVNPDVVNDRSIGVHLQQAFLPSDAYMLVDVVAGPFGEFDFVRNGESYASLSVSDNDQPWDVIYEDQDTDLQVEDAEVRDFMENRNHNLLNEEYIVECVSGDCEEGVAYLISQDNVVGEVVTMANLTNQDSEGDE